MELIGKIKKIMDTKTIGDNFQVREFVLITDINTPYPQHILFQTTREKCTLLDNFKENDEVKVYFSIRGRKWTNPQNEVKYLVSLDVWRIDKVSPINISDSNVGRASSESYSSYAPTSTPAGSTTPSDIQSPNDDNDLPF